MILRVCRCLLLLALVAAAPHRHVVRPRPVFGPPPPPTPFDLCEMAIAGARTKDIPETLLGSIARVESGRLDVAAGRVRPWPWTINVEGVGSYFESKEEAVGTVLALQAKGVKSIDIGCMQVNLMFHPTAFPSVEAGFDPPTNAAYAASFLTALHGQFKDWNLATAAYHSQDQARGEDYQRRVFGQVLTPMGISPFMRPNGPYGAWPPPGVLFGAIPPQSYTFGAFAIPPMALPGLLRNPPRR